MCGVFVLQVFRVYAGSAILVFVSFERYGSKFANEFLDSDSWRT